MKVESSCGSGMRAVSSSGVDRGSRKEAKAAESVRGGGGK